MIGIATSELLFYGGILVVVVALLLALISVLVFTLTGKSLKKKLNLEYGERKR